MHVEPVSHLLERMKQSSTLDALVTLIGPPVHKEQREGFEVWHYLLGVESGMFYNIDVSVWPDQSKQVLMHVEPVPFWKKLKKLK